MFNNRFTHVTLSALALITGLGPAEAASTFNAAPLGLEIGVASCGAAQAKLANAEATPIGQDTWLETVEAEDLYPGATKVAVRCSHDRVIAVQIEISKGGMGNPASQQAYSTLASKYKRVAGAPMPSLGNGYARFVAGNSVIEEIAPHLSFEFTITYYEKNFYDNIQASNAVDRKIKNNKKESAL
jgi:hypothetical protein